MLRATLILLSVIFSSPLLADDFIAGKDYVILHDQAPSKTAAKSIEVLEFFSYGCPWCYKLEAPMHQWLSQHPNVHLVQSPVVFHQEWELYAKAFYTAKVLNLEEKLSPKLFATIQDDQQPLNTPKAMIDFFVAQGVQKSTAQSAFSNSPTIDLKIKAGMKLMAQYRIQAVPAVVVQGKYKTDLQMAQSLDRFFLLLDFLASKAANSNDKAT